MVFCFETKPHIHYLTLGNEKLVYPAYEKLVYPAFPMKLQGGTMGSGNGWCVDSNNVPWVEDTWAYGYSLHVETMDGLFKFLGDEQGITVLKALTENKGFKNVHYYARGEDPGQDRMEGYVPRKDDVDLHFSFHCKVPVLPLKAHGELWHTGWDIPTTWAIDAVNQCWMDNAHGHCMGPVSPETLFYDCEQRENQNEIRKILGLPILRPEWEEIALRNGWTPPPGWKESP